MKKYWKLIALTTVIVCTISTVYIQATIAKSKYPTFVIEHEHGNEAEVKQLTISGNYEEPDRFINTEISVDGTSYIDRLSYVDHLKGIHRPPEIKRLQEEYRNFMRGKDEELNKYFEDQNILAYINIKYDYSYKVGHERNYTLEIDVLDKKVNKATKFDLPIAIGEEHDYIDLQEIQLINGQLKIFTVNQFVTGIDGSSESQIHLYSVDLDTQKLVSDEVIEFTTDHTDDGQSISIFTINYSEDIAPNRYIVFTIEVSKDTYTDDGYNNYELLERQLIAYNLETDERTRIELPGEYSEETYPISFSGTTMYFSKETADEIEVISYNFEEQQIETKQSFSIPEKENDLTSLYTLKNDKLYIVHPLKVGKIDSSIVIADVKTGEILYEGSINLAASSKDEKINPIFIESINVMKE